MDGWMGRWMLVPEYIINPFLQRVAELKILIFQKNPHEDQSNMWQALLTKGLRPEIYQ